MDTKNPLERLGQARGAPSRSPARQRIDQLLEHPQQITEVDTVELHRLINAVAPDDALDLISAAESEQVRDWLDLQVWHGDTPDHDALLEWLHAIVHLPEPAGPSHIRKLDIELLGLLLRPRLRIYLRDESPDEGRDGPLHPTPDNWFVLELVNESDHERDLTLQIVEALYRDDHENARRFLHNLMWEIPSELESWARRWRRGRLEDQGFRDPVEALDIYAYLDPRSVRADEGSADGSLAVDPEPHGRPHLPAILPRGDSFWQQAIDGLEGREAERMADALMHLANRNLSADRVDPADREHAREVLEHLAGRLSLGLEQLAESDSDKASAVLSKVALLRIARLGHSLVLQQQRRLRPLSRVGAFGAHFEFNRLDQPLQEQLTRLCGTRPYFVDEEGSAQRPFQSLDDLRVAVQRVDQAILISRLVPRSVRPPEFPEQVTLSGLFCTEALSLALGRPATALDRTALELAKHRLADGDLREAWLSSAHELADRRIDKALEAHDLSLIGQWIARGCETLAAISLEDFHSRYISTLYVQ